MTPASNTSADERGHATGQDRADKTEYAVCWDYGMGGLWGFVWARSPQEIMKTYPELEIVPESQMPPAVLGSVDRIRAQSSYDIDDPPAGVLDAVLATRARDAEAGDLPRDTEPPGSSTG